MKHAHLLCSYVDFFGTLTEMIPKVGKLGLEYSAGSAYAYRAKLRKPRAATAHGRDRDIPTEAAWAFPGAAQAQPLPRAVRPRFSLSLSCSESNSGNRASGSWFFGERRCIVDMKRDFSTYFIGREFVVGTFAVPKQYFSQFFFSGTLFSAFNLRSSASLSNDVRPR